jgi:hypothetical protein
MEISLIEMNQLALALQEIYLLKTTVWEEIKHNLMEIDEPLQKTNSMQFEAAKRHGAKLRADGELLITNGNQFEFETTENAEEYRKWLEEYLVEKKDIDLRTIPKSALKGLALSGITYEGLKPILV